MEDSLFIKVKKYFLKINNIFKPKEVSPKIYLNYNQAISIATMNKNLKNSMYHEAVDNGFDYGIIELYDFYTTLVKYNGSLYWYIKVLDGMYGLKDNEKLKKGYFDKYSNIRCLIHAISGKYIYINEDFNTNDIHMISADDYLNILFKIK